MKNSKINVFFTINDSYAKYLSVTIASILLNSERYISFYIIDSNISDDSKRRLDELKKIRPFEIEYLPVDKNLFNRVPKGSQKHISMETNYRFLISSIKSKMDKCIFVDADLVFDGDIGNLWDTDVSDYYMAAVTDQAPLKKGSWAEKLPLPQSYVYCNTGVTVMNLKKWREDNIEEKLFENVAKYANLLQFPDQDTLNITLAPKVKYLSHIFNAMPVQDYMDKEQEKEAFQNPVVIHWAGCWKPWINPSVKMADIWWKYAQNTPYYSLLIEQKEQYFKEFQKIKSKISIKIKKYKILNTLSLGLFKSKYHKKIKKREEYLSRIKKYIEKENDEPKK